MTFVINGNAQDQQRWQNLRDTICRTKVGRDLVAEMTDCRNNCTVSFVADNLVAGDGGAVAGPETPALSKVPGKAMVRHFAPDDAVKAMGARDRMATEIAAGWRLYFYSHGGRNGPLERAIAKSSLGLRKIVSRLKNVHLAGGLGTIDEDLIRTYMTTATPIPSEILWRLIWILRGSLTPGTGAAAAIRIGYSIGEWEQGMEPKESRWPWRSAWGTLKVQDGHVIAFHELVHAWRIMMGTRIVDTGWEEEAMTMGLQPFENEKFTENKYRRACKMQLATKHGSATFSSQTMFMQCQSPNEWGKDDKIFF